MQSHNEEPLVRQEGVTISRPTLLSQLSWEIYEASNTVCTYVCVCLGNKAMHKSCKRRSFDSLLRSSRERIIVENAFNDIIRLVKMKGGGKYEKLISCQRAKRKRYVCA